MQISVSVKEAIRQLYYWQQGSDCFTASVYKLMQKADAGNLAKLRKAFPDEYNAWIMWNASIVEDDFFGTYCPELFRKENENVEGRR